MTYMVMLLERGVTVRWVIGSLPDGAVPIGSFVT